MYKRQEQYNEIVIDKNVQLELGYQLNIGDTITLPTAGSKTEDAELSPQHKPLREEVIPVSYTHLLRTMTTLPALQIGLSALRTAGLWNKEVASYDMAF